MAGLAGEGVAVNISSKAPGKKSLLGDMIVPSLNNLGFRCETVNEIWFKNIGGMDEFSGSDYAKMVKKAETVMENAQKNALPPSVISKLILKILNHKNQSLFQTLFSPFDIESDLKAPQSSHQP